MQTRLHHRPSSSRTTLRRSGLAAIAAMLLVACGSDGSQESEPIADEAETPADTDTTATDTTATDTSATADDDESAAANPLLNGVVPTLSGSQVDLAAFAGQDVLVWVWAPW